MSVFKCKMCGGTIEFNQGDTVGVCDYCGTKQTLPRLDNDKKANLYDRANHFRRSNDFDKAMGIYEQILSEDNSDAEAYWSLVLCRYGIEYVEDPQTHKRVPTVNRAQFTSIYADEDYKSALQYADGDQKELYEQEAKEIDEIQKGILTISSKEKPFDIFICYKETNKDGRRTQDSVLANDLYHQLTQEGFKVFFSRITLEDKLGTAYEPYIFAALNSAKVMVVLGTKPEYFNAVWVKNEWSRYLALVKQSGGKKLLIPAYRDMDPYDLPEEFSHLQAQDMSKLGFMQDLIRGIKKIIAPAQKAAVKETVVVNTNNASTAPLLKRVSMFLEDRNWQEADEYCEKVLDLEPENARAYLGKLMAQLMVEKPEQLADCEKSFEDNGNCQKVMRFGSDELRATLKGYIKHINERNETARLTGIYNKALNDMSSADSEEAYKCIAEQLEGISGFKDADDLAEECLEKAEACRKDAVYSTAKSTIATTYDKISAYEAAAEIFESIPGWRDADEQAALCKSKYKQLKEKAEKEKQENLEKRLAAEKAAKKRRKIIAIGTSGLCVCIALVIILITVIIPNHKYRTAISLINDGKAVEAYKSFTALNGYKDSADWAKKCKAKISEANYNSAISLMNKGKMLEAYKGFTALNGYKDSAEKSEQILMQHKDRILKAIKVGDIVWYGNYEQDNDTSNGKEAIAWQVLARENNRLLLISDKALDRQPFSSFTDAKWEICLLRKWLNKTFFKNAFSAKEQAKIQKTKLSIDKNEKTGTLSGDATTDKVFLLSIAEAEKYFSSDEARQCEPTEYVSASGTFGNGDNGRVFWWLRSPGNDEFRSAFVEDSGSIDYTGSRGYCCVRPVIWVDLNK